MRNQQRPNHSTDALTIPLLSEEEEEAVPSGQHPTGDPHHTLNPLTVEKMDQPHRYGNSSEGKETQEDPPLRSQSDPSKTDIDNYIYATSDGVDST